MAVVYAAPGRINLIGEHTDYNLGYALPIALPQQTVATFEPDGSDALTVRSDREEDAVSIPLDTEPGGVTGWAAYVAGVVWALRAAGHRIAGGSMSITSTVAVGAGLSSSAALECAVLGALCTAAGLRIDRFEQARLAQRAENHYVGAPTGQLDQLAALFGESRRALCIDFQHLTVTPVVFDPERSGITLLLIDSHAPHRHAGGEYAARRESCERAAAALGVATLRDLQDRDAQALENILDPVDRRRARHVLTENQRVLDMVAALAISDYRRAGELLTASQASMRDDFGITTGHIDLIADTAVRAGALGARMTGGGFGGCVIALTAVPDAAQMSAAVRRTVTDAGYPAPTITGIRAGAGAHGV
jgi:galactokinase